MLLLASTCSPKSEKKEKPHSPGRKSDERFQPRGIRNISCFLLPDSWGVVRYSFRRDSARFYWDAFCRFGGHFPFCLLFQKVKAPELFIKAIDFCHLQVAQYCSDEDSGLSSDRGGQHSAADMRGDAEPAGCGHAGSVAQDARRLGDGYTVSGPVRCGTNGDVPAASRRIGAGAPARFTFTGKW